MPIADLPDVSYVNTGERLWIDSHVSTHTWTERAKVGEVQYKNADGSSAGSASVYGDKQFTSSRLVWQPMQGHRPMDDLHFYRAIGDTATVQRIARGRLNNVRANRISLGVSAAGVATMASAFAFEGETIGTVFTAGLATTVWGYVGAFYTKKRNQPHAHWTSHEHAETALRRSQGYVAH